MQQNREFRDRKLIAGGLRLIELSAEGTDLTAWHLEAAIAAIHASAESAEATDWLGIVSLYESLMTLRPTPIVALNRAIAIGQCYGPERGIQGVSDIPEAPRLSHYPFYSAALGEFNIRTGNVVAAQLYFENALHLARNAMADHVSDRVGQIEDSGFRAAGQFDAGPRVQRIRGDVLVAARFFPPQAGGAGATVGQTGLPFRVDHDERFNQTSHLKYQIPGKHMLWYSMNRRFDSGEGAGAIATAQAATDPNCSTGTH